jgi:hypothetical protein
MEDGLHFREEKERVHLLQETNGEKRQKKSYPPSG